MRVGGVSLLSAAAARDAGRTSGGNARRRRNLQENETRERDIGNDSDTVSRQRAVVSLLGALMQLPNTFDSKSRDEAVDLQRHTVSA